MNGEAEDGRLKTEAAASSVAASPPPPAVPVTEPIADRVDMPRRRNRWLVPVLAVVVLAAVGIAGFFAVRAGGDSNRMARAVQLYQTGQREAAAGEFTLAARENPKDASPHIYLGRMAREVGNMTVANQELQLAIQLEPDNPVAHREMGSYLLAAGNYELARKFYVRAVTIDSTDRVAIGWLGCTLARLNRVAEAQKFFTHAGPGDWTRCVPVTPAGTPR